MKTANKLPGILKKSGIGEKKIKDVIDSGYVVWDFDPYVVSDRMYGNKQISSSFEIDKFIAYVNGNNEFPNFSRFATFKVKSKAEIDEVLAEPARKRHIENESMSFRGQSKEYKFKRVIPNPVRSNKNGEELSIMPGLYRPVGSIYSFKREAIENRSFTYMLHELEPNNPSVYDDSYNANDIMRVEQHYASQTTGLDISFDIDTAIFFATHRYTRNSKNKAFYEKVQKGEHSGVIYCFRFTNPPVKRTQYLIDKFDLFKTYRPLRVIRQKCGLPLIGEHERNIATTDLDCILYLDKDFHWEGGKTPKYMFPSTRRDRFYGKLLELKSLHPDALTDVVEYEI